MFYTEYRPQKFSDLVGLEKITQALTSQIAKGEVPHALFFYGPRGTGKTSTARLVAKALNCPKVKDGEPCGKCPTCKAVAGGRFLDLIEIDAASNRGIDDIRELREKVKLSPTEAKYKVYIIDEVHMLTTEAFNALLKTLEEPPKHAVFILCTTDPQKVPATIKSRCQKFEFKRAATTAVVKKLQTITDDQAAKVSAADLKIIADASQGGFRDAETLLEEVIKGGITAREAVGFSIESKVVEFVNFLVGKEAAAAINLIGEVYDSGTDLTVWTRELLEYLRKLMLVEAGLGKELVELGDEPYEIIEQQSKKLAGRSWGEELFSQNLVEVFMRAYDQQKNTAIPQLPLEVAVLKILAVTPNSNISQEEAPKAKIAPVTHQTHADDKPKKKSKEKPLELQKIKDLWDQVLIKIRPYNHSLEAVLRSCFVAGVEDRQLIIGAPFKFHLEKLNDAKNYQALLKVLIEVYGDGVSYEGKILKKEVSAAEKSQETGKKARATFSGEVTV